MCVSCAKSREKKREKDWGWCKSGRFLPIDWSFKSEHSLCVQRLRKKAMKKACKIVPSPPAAAVVVGCTLLVCVWNMMRAHISPWCNSKHFWILTTRSFFSLSLSNFLQVFQRRTWACLSVDSRTKQAGLFRQIWALFGQIVRGQRGCGLYAASLQVANVVVFIFICIEFRPIDASCFIIIGDRTRRHEQRRSTTGRKQKAAGKSIEQACKIGRSTLEPTIGFAASCFGHGSACVD